jgi:hypothetical protein
LNEPAPVLSVVIAATDCPEAVARSVASIGESTRGRVERIVASTIAPEPIADVRWIHGAPGSGVPHLRRLGLDQARGPIVVFSEDSCVFPQGWLDGFLDAFDDDRTLAASGPVLPALSGRAIDWAVFFCEYAVFLPRGFSSTARLAGNNFAIRRDLACQLDPDAIHESDVASTALSASKTAERAAAYHIRRYGFMEAIRDRLRFGFEYGRHRGLGLGRAKRLAGFIAGPAILAVQVARLVVQVGARPRYLGVFVEALPVTLALLTAWSVGEWLGWSRAAISRR